MLCGADPVSSDTGFERGAKPIVETSMILGSNHVNQSRTTLMIWMDCGNEFKM